MVHAASRFEKLLTENSLEIRLEVQSNESGSTLGIAYTCTCKCIVIRE